LSLPKEGKISKRSGEVELFGIKFKVFLENV